MNDVISKEQLEAQLRRREDYLEKCRKEDADEKMLRKLEKDLQLTKRRLERLKE